MSFASIISPLILTQPWYTVAGVQINDLAVLFRIESHPQDPQSPAIEIHLG